jgi:hypothetical protein
MHRLNQSKAEMRRMHGRAAWKRRRDRCYARGLSSRGLARRYRVLPSRPPGVSRQLWRYRVLREERLAAGLTTHGKPRRVNYRRMNPWRRRWLEFRATLNLARP